ncbi:hypothetical protein V6N13_063633 [Hibiscus sabdariffa]
MCKCRSHGTFPLFGLQSSHLNICYYHQDLHRRPLRPGSRPGFYGDRRALTTHRGLALAPTAGYRHALTRTLLRRSRSVGGAPVRDPTNQLPCALRVF